MSTYNLDPGLWTSEGDWILWLPGHTGSHSPMTQVEFGEAELPAGGPYPSPWLAIGGFTGTLPNPSRETVLGVEVTVNAHTPDATAMQHMPVPTPFLNSVYMPRDVVLVMDYSGSMTALSYPGGPSKLDEAKDFARQLIHWFFRYCTGTRVAIVSFDKPEGADPGYRMVAPFTSDWIILEAALAASNEVSSGLTFMQEGLQLAADYADANATQPVIMVMPTDGGWTTGDPTSTVQDFLTAHPSWLFYVVDWIVAGDGISDLLHTQMQNLGANVGSGYFTISGQQLADHDYNDALLGIEVAAEAPYFPLEIALSLDGINPLDECDTWYIFPTTFAQDHLCGSSTYTWSRPQAIFPAADFRGAFTVLARRPPGHTAVESQYVTAARVRITTLNPEGTLAMPPLQELTEVVLLGREATPGTIAPSFRRMRALNYKIRANTQQKKHRPQGEKMYAISQPTRLWSTGTLSGLLDYNEAPIPLECIIGAGVHSGTGVLNQRNVHVYNLDNRKRSIYQTHSVQRGEDGIWARQALYVVHAGLQLQINTQDCQISGAIFGQGLGDNITLAQGRAEVQLMTVVGVPVSGTYRLAFKGAETADLPYNANAAAIQTALQALSTIGAGNLLVSGTGPFTFTWAGTLAHDQQPMVVLVKNNLGGGTDPTVTVDETTPGGYDYFGTLQPVMPQHWNIYAANSQATLLANKLDKTVGVAAAGIDIADRHNPFWVLDRDLVGAWADTTEMDPKFKANLLVGAKGQGMQFLSSLVAGTTKWLRMEAVGPVIGSTTDPHKMIWEGACKVDDSADFGNEEGRVVIPWPFEWCEGPNGEVPTLTIENGIPGSVYAG